MAEDVKAAFRARPHLVDEAPGYVRMDVLSPVETPSEIWLITHWESKTAFDTWHHSHRYHESHKGIPKGLKLVPGEAKIRHFQYVSA